MKSAQNRAVKIMKFIPYGSYDMNPVYNEIEILQMEKIYKLEVGKFMYKFSNHLLPENFEEYFKHVSTIHNYNTRMAENNCMYPIRAKSKFIKKTLKYKGVEVWNSLPNAIKQLPSVKSFSKQLKSSFIDPDQQRDD